ncbi:MAG TPA: hypothetical protein VJQ82_09910 [Terriglobales bacterium]|nr:hypothetical protein [Terriglobales bacterium]
MTADEYMAVIHERRRIALDRFVRSFPYPHVKRASRVLEMNAQNLKQMRNGSYLICERRARLIEERMGMEFGSLDKEAA